MHNIVAYIAGYAKTLPTDKGQTTLEKDLLEAISFICIFLSFCFF